MRTLLELLAYEAGRRPEIAALVARIDTLTEADIAAAIVPLPWYRTALRELRQSTRAGTLGDRIDRELTRHGIATFADGGRRYTVCAGATADPAGELRVWQGGARFLPMQGASVLMDDGALLWLPQAGGLWVAHAYSATVHADTVRASRRLGVLSRRQYLERLRAQANALDPAGPAGAEAASTPAATALASYGVRFFRPRG